MDVGARLAPPMHIRWGPADRWRVGLRPAVSCVSVSPWFAPTQSRLPRAERRKKKKKKKQVSYKNLTPPKKKKEKQYGT
eukprot:NODE_24527_length_621_cov_2.856275.p3 GENE.NODE_24527_length_621_cov_2.856275~~NODE_24527_length_621_cov_2.856275.p3  ORF type:complete len:79 (+),score=15.33 NODE_24527_length_621_cov_2.856275:290-526(+)